MLFFYSFLFSAVIMETRSRCKIVDPNDPKEIAKKFIGKTDQEDYFTIKNAGKKG